MNESMFFMLYGGAFIFGIIFLIFMPVFGYKQGKKINAAGRYGALSLASGGVLFFVYMMFVAYTEYNLSQPDLGGFEGVVPGVISIVGVVAIIIGLLWRLIIGINKSPQ